MRTRYVTGMVTIMTVLALLVPSSALARDRHGRRGHDRKAQQHKHHNRGDQHVAAAHGIAALIGLAILCAALDDDKDTEPHTCRIITRREWVPGHYEPVVERRWVRTRHGGFWEEFTTYRWVKGYYRTVRIKDPGCRCRR